LYGAARPEFQPGPEQGREQRAQDHSGVLTEDLILELPPMALRREEWANHLRARALHERECITCKEAKREWHGRDCKMSSEGFHVTRIT
jgi:hypothetical protein